jgi:hypothetical protein
MDGKHITLVTIGTVLMMLVAALRLGGSWNYEDGTSWSRAPGSASVVVSTRGVSSAFATNIATRLTRVA